MHLPRCHDAMLFQMELSDDKGMGSIFDSLLLFFLICEKYIFSSIFYAVLFLYFAFVMLPLKTFFVPFYFVPLFMLNLLLFLH